MSFQQPLTFEPHYMDRVWGGRSLETKLRRCLPKERPIGESWELVDREDVQSTVNYGDLTGTTLNELWLNMREMVFGEGLPDGPRFPLLAKILDARDTLSVQVHPPAEKAAKLKGEPKTEMWYLLDTDSEAALYAGFKKGVDRQSLEDHLSTGDVEPLLHKLPVKAGDAMFIPSGRCHAIGAGCFIIEIQQNSDTTYRVFDWNRKGLDGKPRDLHIAESLESIDFADYEPALATRDGEVVVECPLFKVERWELDIPRADESNRGVIFTVLSGEVVCCGRSFRKGDFFLLPAVAEDRALVPVEPKTAVLRTTIP
jgi:mannose-6-phosphate isomerase